MSKVKVLLTLFQDPIEVDEDELVNLRQQGLLKEVLSDDSKAPAKAKAAVKEND